MTAVLLDIAELAARAEVPVTRVHAYAETGLLSPAQRDGDRLGYPPQEVGTVRMLAGADDLGLGADTLTMLAAARRDGDCGSTQRRLAIAVSARLDQVQAALSDRNRDAAVRRRLRVRDRPDGGRQHLPLPARRLVR